MRGLVVAAISVITLILTSGCATVTGSSTQSLAVETRSSQSHEQVGDASCRLTNSKGNWLVKTPGLVTITRSNDPLQVVCEKEGHAPGIASAISATRAAMFGNILIGGVVGAVADHASGAAYEYPNILRIVMGSSISVGPPDLSGDGQPPPALMPMQPSSQSAAAKRETPSEVHASTAASTRDPRLPARLPRVGDRWKYRYTDRWTNLTKGPILHEIAAVSEKEIREYTRMEKGGSGGYEQYVGPDAEFIEHRLSGVPEFAPYLQAFDLLEKPGFWEGIPAESGGHTSAKWSFRGNVVGKDLVSVPAGTFTATRVELTGSRTFTEPYNYYGTASPARSIATRSKIVAWYAPEVKRVVKFTRDSVNIMGAPIEKDTYELLEYKVQ